MAKVNYMKKTMIIIFGLSLLLGMIVALVFAYRNSKPLQSIIHTISSQFGVEQKNSMIDAYGYIHNSFRELKDSKEELEAVLSAQIPLLRVTFFERLCKGEFRTEKEIKSYMQQLNISFFGEQFTVALVHIREQDNMLSKDTLEELNVKRYLIKEELQRANHRNYYHLHDVEEDKIAILFNYNNNKEKDTLRMMLDDFVKQLSSFQSIVIGIGNTYPSMLNISRSFDEAKQTVIVRNWELERKMMWHHELPQATIAYYFPTDVQQRLLNLIQAGEEEEVEHCLLALVAANTQERELPPPIMRLFVSELYGCILKATEFLSLTNAPISEDIQENIKSIGTLERTDKALHAAIEWSKTLCQHVNSKKRSHNLLLAKDMVHFIETNYMNADMNVNRLSSQFGLSDNYASQLLKEQTGMSFSNLLEQIRMNRAKDLLMTTDLSINEISSAIGYLLPSSFCRAFKRIYGMNTTIYKNTHRLK